MLYPKLNDHITFARWVHQGTPVCHLEPLCLDHHDEGKLPDLGLFWFYFADYRAFHDDDHWVYTPGFCVTIAAVAVEAMHLLQAKWLTVA